MSENDVKGYKWIDIEKTMNKKTRKLFHKFMDGQTVAILNKDVIVYKGDYERFYTMLMTKSQEE